MKTNYLSYTKEHSFTQKELLAHATDKYQIYPSNNYLSRTGHAAAKAFSLPARLGLRALAHSIEPLPGKDKNWTLYGLAVRISALFSACILLPLGLPFATIAIPFHLASHPFRPSISMIHNPAATAPKPNSSTFTVRTHNLGFVYDFMRIVGDLRDVKTRAAEIGQWLSTSPELPEVIVFQEGFHLDATGVLCEQLKEKYPYVIHNIAPHISGLSNGAIIASQHPIEELTYRPFDNMLGPEKWSTRGLIKVRIQRNGKPIDVYGTHLQALLGKERAAVRAQQIGQIAEWVKEDQEKNPASAAIVVGDMNASQVTAWGEKSEEDNAFFESAEKDFVDIFRNDHDELGTRTSGSSRFALQDSPEGHNLEEPSGSWFVGPFADKGLIMSLKELYERVVHHVPVKTQAKEMPRPHHWGTPNWSAVQHACSARFDFIFRFKKSRFTGWFDRAEIRRVKVDPKVQSAPSDHAPLDARIRIGLL